MANWINLVFLLLKRIFLAKEVYSDESLKQKQKVGRKWQSANFSLEAKSSFVPQNLALFLIIFIILDYRKFP